MENIWKIYEKCMKNMKHIWKIYEKYGKYGIYMKHIWKFGKHMEHIWRRKIYIYIYIFIWNIYGKYMTNIWNITWICMDMYGKNKGNRWKY